MAYDDSNSVYSKYQTSGTSEEGNDCGCGTSSDCSCCPTGTVGVYSEDGEHVGCLTPNDAELYNNALINPPEGFVKVFDPTTGAYLGAMSPSEAIEMLNYLSNAVVPGQSGETFNIVTPEIGVSGFYELSYTLAAGITGDIDLLLDRVGITDTVTVSIQNSVEDFQFNPSGTTTTIPLNESDKTVQVNWTGILSTGVYTFVLRFATTSVTKEVPVRITLT